MKDSSVLLIDCPDRKGLVARVSGLLYQWGANILHSDQHQHQDHDLGLFFTLREQDRRLRVRIRAGGELQSHRGVGDNRSSRQRVKSGSLACVESSLIAKAARPITIDATTALTSGRMR